jgi:hypothetical protein
MLWLIKWIKDYNEKPKTEMSTEKQGKHFKMWAKAKTFWIGLQKLKKCEQELTNGKE